MSDDIVDRLRRAAAMRSDPNPLEERAADEIERLRGALHGERFAHQRTTEWWDTTRVERDRLRDGIAEHKAAALADGDCDCDECATTLPGFPSYDRFLWSLIEEET